MTGEFVWAGLTRWGSDWCESVAPADVGLGFPVGSKPTYCNTAFSKTL